MQRARERFVEVVHGADAGELFPVYEVGKSLELGDGFTLE